MYGSKFLSLLGGVRRKTAANLSPKTKEERKRNEMLWPAKECLKKFIK